MILRSLHLSFVFFLLSLIALEVGDFSLYSEQQPLTPDFEVETEIVRPERVVKKIQPKIEIKINNPIQVAFDWSDTSENNYSLVVLQPTLNFSISGAKQAKETTTSAS